MAESFLRVDGEEHPVTGARLVWQPASCEGREGLLFQVAAHGPRTLVHVQAWAPGAGPADLSGQTVAISSPGADAALDGRLFDHLTVRFGRVGAERCVLSVDGSLDPLEAGDARRARVEADLRGPVQPLAVRGFCLGCGTRLAGLEALREAFAGGLRVQVRTLPWLCTACDAARAMPGHCPACGMAVSGDAVHTLGDDVTGETGFTVACGEGHVFSGRLVRPA